MCGRFTLTRTDEVAEFFELDERPDLDVRFNVAPSQDVFVITETAGAARAGRFMRWGLLPRLRSTSNSSLLINARAETAHRKESFRESFRTRRCAIAADGFYEWKQEQGVRQPYHFRLATGGLFAFAGLWDTSVNPSQQQDDVEGCAILTTAPNPLVADVHDRMPVILDRETLGLWLGQGAAPGRLKRALETFPEDRMLRVAVNPAVNRTDMDGPACLDPPPRRHRNLQLFS